MFGGRIVGVVAPDIPREEIGLMMAGASKPTADAVGRGGNHG